MNCKNKDKGGCCHTDGGRGCTFCNCHNEPQAEMCEGYFKLHATDWLANYPDMKPTDVVEVRFKNTRKGYYQNTNNLPLAKGDIVAVESSPGHDIGIVSLTGDMVARQMKRVGFFPQNGEFRKVYRKAKPYDIEKWQEAIAMEHETMIAARQIAADLRLEMKIGDVEYQGDKIKAIFYYIADERVDFRELIKIFAEQFRIKIEMKQIGARQEAGRIGGLGSCGRELCCASWISGFVSVTTSAARTQELSLNPQKLAGQCSKLKCCLGYEFDTYMDARREFPRLNQPLQTLDGDYYAVKNDILAGTITFSTSQYEMAGLVTLPVSRVKEVIEINKRGRKADTIIVEPISPKEAEPNFVVNIEEMDSITRFDAPRGEKRSGNRPPRNKNRNGGGNGGGNGNNGGQSGAQGGGNNQRNAGGGGQGGNAPRPPRGNNNNANRQRRPPRPKTDKQ